MDNIELMNNIGERKYSGIVHSKTNIYKKNDMKNINKNLRVRKSDSTRVILNDTYYYGLKNVYQKEYKDMFRDMRKEDDFLDVCEYMREHSDWN